MSTRPLRRIGFGGGCHWCTEAVFQALRGVQRVEQGYIASLSPEDAFSEAVIVHYDPERLDLPILIEAHLHTHASTSEHSMRHKYRSAIYCFDDEQAARAQRELAALQAGFDTPLVPRVLPFAAFEPSDTRLHDYYARHPERQFCQTYIEPKLAVLKKRLGARVQAR